MPSAMKVEDAMAQRSRSWPGRPASVSLLPPPRSPGSWAKSPARCGPHHNVPVGAPHCMPCPTTPSPVPPHPWRSSRTWTHRMRVLSVLLLVIASACALCVYVLAVHAASGHVSERSILYRVTITTRSFAATMAPTARSAVHLPGRHTSHCT